MSYNDESFWDKLKLKAPSVLIVLIAAVGWIFAPMIVPEDGSSLFKEILVAAVLAVSFVVGYQLIKKYFK